MQLGGGGADDFFAKPPVGGARGGTMSRCARRRAPGTAPRPALEPPATVSGFRPAPLWCCMHARPPRLHRFSAVLGAWMHPQGSLPRGSGARETCDQGFLEPLSCREAGCTPQRGGQTGGGADVHVRA